MKKYYVSLPFSGSLSVQVEALSEEEALEKGKKRIENLTDDDVIDSIVYENYEVYE